MTDSHDYVPGTPHLMQHPRHDHERTEVHASGIFLFAAILTVFIIMWMAILYFLIREYYSGRQELAESSRPARFDDMSGLYPGARLQGNPTADLIRARAEEDKVLNSYGWDEKAGIGRIPIDRALDIVAKKGLPTRSAHESPAAPPAPSAATSPPSPSPSPSPLPFAR